MQAESRERTLKLRGLAPEERRKQAKESSGKTWERMHQKMAEILKPDQIKRFDQIAVQNSGFFAFQMPHVRERLKLTEDQVAKYLAVQEELLQMAPSRAVIQQQALADPEGMRKKADEAAKAAIAKVVATLTDEQKATWADLTGPPFRVKFERPSAP